MTADEREPPPPVFVETIARMKAEGRMPDPDLFAKLAGEVIRELREDVQRLAEQRAARRNGSPERLPPA